MVLGPLVVFVVVVERKGGGSDVEEDGPVQKSEAVALQLLCNEAVLGTKKDHS